MGWGPKWVKTEIEFNNFYYESNIEGILSANKFYQMAYDIYYAL